MTPSWNPDRHKWVVGAVRVGRLEEQGCGGDMPSPLPLFPRLPDEILALCIQASPH